METCQRCNGWFDPRTEGVQQHGLFDSSGDLILCEKCFDDSERAARAALKEGAHDENPHAQVRG